MCPTMTDSSYERRRVPLFAHIQCTQFTVCINKLTKLVSTVTVSSPRSFEL